MNVGKSSLVNALTGQETAMVSHLAGTTTDPVKKIIEILGLGPVTLVDTAGLDDVSELGAQRIAKTREVLNQTDLAIIVFTGSFGEVEKDYAALCRVRNVPFFFVHNKMDLYPAAPKELEGEEVIEFSCKGEDTADLIAAIIRHMPKNAYRPEDIFGGYVKENDEVLLVTPIDTSAPEGRLILPQVQTIRCLLDNKAISTSLQPPQLEGWLKKHTPDLVVADSQIFDFVVKYLPETMPLTSFSILFSRLKGDFDYFLQSTPKIDDLQDGDKVLIMESCSHSVNVCDDIGRMKIPAWLQRRTGKKLQFDFITHLDPLPLNLADYKLALQCGGCMVTRTQVMNRINRLRTSGVPVSNYGMAIAWCTGIFNRVTEIFRR